MYQGDSKSPFLFAPPYLFNIYKVPPPMGLGQWDVCINGNVCINGEFRSSVYIKVGDVY